MIPYGTLINAGAVIAGGLIGLLFHSKIPEKYSKIVFQGIGLFTLYIGFKMADHTQQILILVFSMVLGGLTGEWLNLEKRLEKFSDFIKGKTNITHSTFSEGMITAFLLFCMGSMTILGAFEEGTQGNMNLLLAKSVMDGFGAIALTSALGLGVLFSIIPLLIFQGGLTYLAFFFGNNMPETMVNEMTAAGGLILIGLGISLLEIKKIKLVNLLPALVYALLITYLVQLFPA